MLEIRSAWWSSGVGRRERSDRRPTPDAERGQGVGNARKVSHLSRFEDGRSFVVVDRWDGDRWRLLRTFFPTGRGGAQAMAAYRRGTLLYERRDGGG